MAVIARARYPVTRYNDVYGSQVALAGASKMVREGIRTRLIHRSEDDGSFDHEFWRKAGAEGRFAAAWEMVVEAELFKGKNADQSRLQRSIARLQRRGR